MRRRRHRVRAHAIGVKRCPLQLLRESIRPRYGGAAARIRALWLPRETADALDASVRAKYDELWQAAQAAGRGE